jgi:HEAT repeat protein
VSPGGVDSILRIDGAITVSDGQLDLFSGSGIDVAWHGPVIARLPAPRPAELDGTALLDAIPASGLADGPALAAEAGQRRLGAAIPVLEDYCRRFAGFGTEHALPEQVAALEALAAIGGPDTAAAVGRIISRRWVTGPTLATAVSVAARLGSQLPANVVLTLLRHTDPAVRADACRLAKGGADVVATLVDLLGDLHRNVSLEAACSLGRMGRPEGAPLLKQALRQAPSPGVIDAVPPIADDECVVLLGRIARGPARDLAVAALGALEAVAHPLATRVLERLSA